MLNQNDDLLVDDFIVDFIAESDELLNAIEPDLLAMEKEGTDVSRDLVNRVFRAVHSIKGGAGFSGFETLKDLSHTLESVLMQIREGGIQLNAAVMDALLSGIDKIRLLLKNIHSSQDVPIGEELNFLNQILNADTDTDTLVELPFESIDIPEAPELPSSPPAEPEILESLVGDDLLDDFIADIRDALDSIEPDLLYMEKHNELSSPDLINRVFRAVHSIKGGAGFCGFRALKQLSHIMENVLTELRDHQLTPTPEIMDALLTGLDKIRVMVNDIQKSESVTYDDEMQALNRILNSKNIEPSESVPVKLKEKAKEEVKPVIQTNKPIETIRISVNLIDCLMNLAGELVLARNQLRQKIEQLVDDNQEIGPLIQNVDGVTTEIQENIMKMRMQPIGNQFNKFPRTVRDLARQTSKQVELDIEGAEVELDKTILENLSNPLTHLIRNCIDHGIESPQERTDANKSPCGYIHLRAFHEGGQVNITISDDGRGIDADKVTAKAVLNEILTDEQAKRMSTKEQINLIFTPGLSTASAITDISGRGVGMDVVKTNIQELGGHIDIDSHPGQGTTIHIILPLTLAIIPSLIIGVAGHRFAIPQINVQELVSIKAGDPSQKIEKVGKSDVLRLRDRLLPLIKLTDILDLKPIFKNSINGSAEEDRRARLVDRRHDEKKDMIHQDITDSAARKKQERRQSWRSDLYIVVLKVGSNIFGLCVDTLFDNEEIVVKPLSEHVKDCRCFAGATIMGDGRVAMILDASGIAAHAKLRFSEIRNEELRRENEEIRRQKSSTNERQSIIVFNYALEEFFALPLTSITRLEIIDQKLIKKVGEQEFLTYRGAALPLIRLEKYLPIRPLPENPKDLFVIIPTTKHTPIGILTSRILDTIDINVPIIKDSLTAYGFKGSAIINGQLILFLDTEELVDLFEKGAESAHTKENIL